MMMRAFLAALAALALSACAGGPGGTDLAARLSGFPPDRSAFDALPPLSAAIHARAVEAALEGQEGGTAAQAWSVDDGTAGTVRVLDTWVYDDALLCRSVIDRIEPPGQPAIEAKDMACWSGTEWVWLRNSATPPAVLAPARALPAVTAKGRTDLATLARRAKVPVAVVAALNPRLDPKRVAKGEVVILPPR